MLPSQYLALPREEKAFVIGSIKQKIEDDKKNAEKMKRKSKGKNR